MSEENIAPPGTTNGSFVPTWISIYSIPTVKFNRDSLQQHSASFIHGNVVNLYISYKLDVWSRDLSTDFRLGNWLFEAVKLTKNVDPDKYGSSAYGFRLDAQSRFL